MDHGQYQAALHEAGHAVVACALGHPPGRIYIERTQAGWKGACEVSIPADGSPLHRGAIAAAGPLSEAGLQGPLPDGFETDMSRLWDSSAQATRRRFGDAVGEDPKDVFAAAVECAALATRVAERCWDAIKQLADELVSYGEIDDPCGAVDLAGCADAPATSAE